MANETPDSPASEAAIRATAKVTLSQAIAAAELATGGKAAGVGIEDQNGEVHFDVTILKDNARQNVLVDPKTGAVMKVVAANADINSEGAESVDGAEGAEGAEAGAEHPEN